MGMKRNGDFTAVCLVCVGVLACLLPRPSGAAAAADSTWRDWHLNPTSRGQHDSASAAQRHDDGGNRASLRAIHRTPAQRHGGLPPLSAPPPTAGADLPSLPPHGDALTPPSRAPQQAPHFGFPLQPAVGFAAPPAASAGAPSAGEGYPFIGSNPTVPLPTGMTDTATVLPLPDRGDGTGKQVVGRAALVRVQIAMIGLQVIFSVFFLSSS